MKTNSKAIIASVIVIALALTAVSGVTYSWFSDTENANISVSTANIDIIGEYEKYDGSHDANIIKTSNEDYVGDLVTNASISTDKKDLEITDMLADRTITAKYKVTNNSTVDVLYRMYVSVDGITDGLATDSIKISAGTGNTIPITMTPFTNGISYVVGTTNSGHELKSSASSNTYVFTVTIIFDKTVSSAEDFSVRIVNEAYQKGYTYTDAQAIVNGQSSMPTIRVNNDVTFKGVAVGENNTVKDSEIEVIFSSGAANVATNNGSNAVILKTTMLEPESAVAKIDLSLDGAVQTDFGENNWVTVTVSIPGSYTDLQVYYNGAEDEQPQVISITPDGDKTKVTFRTNHFSNYEIVNNKITVDNEIGLYSAIKCGITEINVSSAIKIERSGILDLKGATVTASNGVSPTLEVRCDVEIINGNIINNGGDSGRAINVMNVPGIDLILKNVKVFGPESGTYTRGISFYNTSESSLIADDCTFSCNYYAINVAGGCPNFRLNVTNSTMSGWCAYQTWSENTSGTFTNCTLLGVNDKTYSAEGWNNFATIVIYEDAINSVLTLTGCTVEANQNTGNDQDLFSFGSTGTVCTATGTNFMVNGQTASLEGLKNIGVKYTGNTISLNGMEDWYKTASTYSDLKKYLEGGYYCSLTDNIEMQSEVNEVSCAIIIPEGVYSALNFNGFNITVTAKNGIKIFGILDVHDHSDSRNGGMNATGGTYDDNKGNPVLLWASGSGDLFIYGGNYHSGNYGQCVYASPGSEIVIEGGKFYNEQLPGIDAKYGYIINQANVSEQLITVYEGTFVGYNPADGDDQKDNEKYNSPSSFLAEDSTSTEDPNGVWVVTNPY